MGHLTYKVFNLHFYIQCGTYYSHLLACIIVVSFSATDRLPGRTLRRTGALIPLLGHWGEPGGTAHIEAITTTLVRKTPHSYPKP